MKGPSRRHHRRHRWACLTEANGRFIGLEKNEFRKLGYEFKRKKERRKKEWKRERESKRKKKERKRERERVREKNDKNE